MPGEWFETFFEEIYPEHWTGGWEALAPEEAEKGASFAVRALEIEPPARVLDLCCGAGRHSLWLARRGFDVTGVDLTSRYLEIARKAAEQEGLQVRWVECDMRRIEFECEFDAAISMNTAFGYFEDEEHNMEVLRRLGRALKPGGRAFFDLPSRDGMMGQFQPCCVAETPAGHLRVEQRQFEPLSGLLRAVGHVFDNGARRDYTLTIRWYALSEFRRALEEAGLAFARVYADWEGGEFTRESPRMLVVAQKSG